jgi:hypothetical protein
MVVIVSPFGDREVFEDARRNPAAKPAKAAAGSAKQRGSRYEVHGKLS